MLKNGGPSAKGDNPNRKHCSARIAGGWHWADNPICKKTMVTKSEETTAGLTLLRRNGKCLKDLGLESWNVLALRKVGRPKLRWEERV